MLVLYLSAIVLPNITTNEAITWSSSDASIAVVTQTGMVVGLTEGSAIITAECQGVSASCKVTVKPVIPVTGITLGSYNVKILPGDMKVILAHIIPSNASNQKVTWKTSSPNVVKIESSSDNQVIIRAVTYGVATITAKTDDGGFTASCSVTVWDKY